MKSRLILKKYTPSSVALLCKSFVAVSIQFSSCFPPIATFAHRNGVFLSVCPISAFRYKAGWKARNFLETNYNLHVDPDPQHSARGGGS